jgi:hypothetical protein
LIANAAARLPEAAHHLRLWEPTLSLLWFEERFRRRSSEMIEARATRMMGTKTKDFCKNWTEAFAARKVRRK